MSGKSDGLNHSPHLDGCTAAADNLPSQINQYGWNDPGISSESISIPGNGLLGVLSPATVSTEGINTMKRIVGLTLSGIFLTGALAHAQTPIVKVEAPGNTIAVQAPAPAPAPMPMSTAPAINPLERAEPPAAERDKFLLQKLLESSPAGQTLAGNGWEIYGWTQGTFTTGSVRRTSLPVPFTDRIDQFSLNQNWLHVHKNVDTEKKEFQIGGVADLILPGTDYRFTPSRGLLTERQARGETYGIDLYQAYVDMFLPNLGGNGTTIRVGKFNTYCEYEVVQGISTPFASRSYLFQYNPFTHTGLNAITQLNDDWWMANGIVLGSDNFFNDATRPTYIGHLAWAPKKGKNSAALNVVITDPTFDSNKNFNFYNVYNVQLTHKFTDKLQYVADATYSHMDGAPGIGFTEWYGLANYLLYDVNDKLQAKTRVELFNDEQGFRTGTSGLYTAVTAGLTWKPTPWLWVMPEVRYDHNSDGRPFEGNDDMFTATIGAILRW